MPGTLPIPRTMTNEFNESIFKKAIKENKIIQYERFFRDVVVSYVRIQNEEVVDNTPNKLAEQNNELLEALKLVLKSHEGNGEITGIEVMANVRTAIANAEKI